MRDRESVRNNRGVATFDELGRQLLMVDGDGAQGQPARLGAHRLARRAELLESVAEVHGVADHGVLETLL